ncbi:hematopoietic cell signal transducer [Rhinichthys klamathensis goyatoka]|uniref:hematopoietic cell signal transducer n=1 Tax=Rhinichthys klamathensis goyatoka TaxID=3034132 RepID=UPI0024B5059D|nr:hematopoietic cell signal transducer [Rhinichthys klamathensis goyatoka]
MNRCTSLHWFGERTRSHKFQTQEMTKNGLFFLSLLAMVSAVEDKGSCYGIGSGTMAGIIFADVAVTIFIVSTTYWYASKRRQKKENADEVYMNVRANCKT